MPLLNQIFLAFASALSSVFPFARPPSSSQQFDLLVNGQSRPPALIVLDDIKPGDTYEIPKTLRLVGKKPATVWLHLNDVRSDQGFSTEPEESAENGVPKYDLENHTLYALAMGNSDIISSLAKVPLAAAVSCWIPLGTIQPHVSYRVLQKFSWDKTLGNWAQGDKTVFTEEFYAQDAALSSPPPSATGRVWDPISRTCRPISVTPTPRPTSPPRPTATPSPAPKPTATPRPKPTCYPVPTITISGNAAGSQNTVIYNYGCRTEIRQNNQTTIITRIDSSSSTGSNSASP